MVKLNYRHEYQITASDVNNVHTNREQWNNSIDNVRFVCIFVWSLNAKSVDFFSVNAF